MYSAPHDKSGFSVLFFALSSFPADAITGGSLHNMQLNNLTKALHAASPLSRTFTSSGEKDGVFYKATDDKSQPPKYKDCLNVRINLWILPV